MLPVPSVLPAPDSVFLDELSPEQRRAVLVLARQIIDADRRLAIQEVERLDRLYVEAGLGAESASAPTQVGDLNVVFSTARARVIVVLELLLVAYADGEFAASELATIRDLAARMELDAGVWESALDWASRYNTLLKEAAAFGREAAVGQYES